MASAPLADRLRFLNGTFNPCNKSQDHALCCEVIRLVEAAAKYRSYAKVVYLPLHKVSGSMYMHSNEGHYNLRIAEHDH